MAQRATLRARSSRRSGSRASSARSLLRAVATWSHLDDAFGLVLVGFSIISLLALFQPEGSVAGPLGGALVRALGWLAALVPVWTGILGMLLISHHVERRSWPRGRLLAGVV